MVVIDERDIGKSKIEILMDLIWEFQQVKIPEDHITYGTPQELDARPEIMTDANTFIPCHIDPNYDDRFSKNSGFMYRRRTLDEHLGNVQLTITIDRWPITTRELLRDYVNPQLEFPIDPEDIVDYELPDPESNVVLLVAEPGSFLWTGQFELIVIPIDPGYFDLVQVQSLPGFNLYVDPGV